MELDQAGTLKESEERYRRLVEMCPDAIAVHREGRIVYLNPAGWRLMGAKSPEEVMGRLLLDFVHPDFRPVVRKRVTAMLGEGSMEPLIEEKFMRLDGTVMDVEVAASPFFFEGGGAVQVIFRDITRRKQTEAKLRESESRFKAILSSLDDWVITLDARGRLAFCQAPWRERAMDGWSMRAGGSYPEIMPPVFQNRLKESWAGIQQGRSEDFEYVLEDPSGARWFSAKLTPLIHENVFDGAVAVVREITERIRSEETRLRSLEDLKKNLEATVQALASAMELRDPSTAGHQSRTALIACAIAGELGLSDDRIEGLRIAASVHDIGKITIPAEILSKPGKLLPLEMQLIRTHAQTGYDILRSIAFPWPVAEIVLQHGEHVDGSGYPRHLHLRQILLEARILAVADTVDAMLSHRPYRAGCSLSKTLMEIQQFKDAYFDPEVVDACVRLFEEKGMTL